MVVAVVSKRMNWHNIAKITDKKFKMNILSIKDQNKRSKR